MCDITCVVLCLLQWFDEQQQSYELLDSHLKKLHQAIETMISCRKGTHRRYIIITVLCKIMSNKILIVHVIASCTLLIAYYYVLSQLHAVHGLLTLPLPFSADVCLSTNAFVKSVATLGNVEENDTLSRALSRLSEVEEKVEGFHQEQVSTRPVCEAGLYFDPLPSLLQIQKDLFIFGEMVKDYIALLGSIKVSLEILSGHREPTSSLETHFYFVPHNYE